MEPGDQELFAELIAIVHELAKHTEDITEQLVADKVGSARAGVLRSNASSLTSRIEQLQTRGRFGITPTTTRSAQTEKATGAGS